MVENILFNVDGKSRLLEVPGDKILNLNIFEEIGKGLYVYFIGNIKSINFYILKFIVKIN